MTRLVETPRADSAPNTDATADAAPFPRTGARMRDIRHSIALGLSGAVLLVVIALAAFVIVLPKAAGATPLTVLSGSMAPALPIGSLIIVRPVPLDELAVGDVITYQLRSGEPEVVTHRIIAVSMASDGTRAFSLQGDNNPAPDPDPVVADQVRGRVWYSVPYLGYVSNAVTGESRAWIVPAVAVALLGYAAYALTGGVTAAVAAGAKRGRHAAPRARRHVRGATGADPLSR
ncbi:signal peptidase I [Planctomonas psychrotolerans]|uniref:signal peptidase I n=1 Tax=Planctomonas psychrotolerans TaxID=2528712 RepID=UPI0012387FE1|nr:signal peptidase I [Planctomonas psychrotolerans]